MSAVELHTRVIDGVRIAYEEYGTGQPLALVHGFGASSYSWRAVATEMADSHRCILPNLMGFGFSEKPNT